MGEMWKIEIDVAQRRIRLSEPNVALIFERDHHYFYLLFGALVAAEMKVLATDDELMPFVSLQRLEDTAWSLGLRLAMGFHDRARMAGTLYHAWNYRFGAGSSACKFKPSRKLSDTEAAKIEQLFETEPKKAAGRTGFRIQVPAHQIRILAAGSLLESLLDNLTEPDSLPREDGQATTLLYKRSHLVPELVRHAHINVPANGLMSGVLQRAEAMYLKSVADRFLYVDFKGIEQLEKFIPLKLDEVFVNVKVRAEAPISRQRDWQDDFVHRRHRGSIVRQPDIDEQLLELDIEQIQRTNQGSDVKAIDAFLATPGSVVLLGGPGSGKTTLIKRLARSCALGPAVLKEHYPSLPWCFPLIVPITRFEQEHTAGELLNHIVKTLRDEGGDHLVRVFHEYWSTGRCLLLLDGVDEVAEMAARIECTRAVDRLLNHLSDNRVLIASRPMGYNVCRLAVPARHVFLQSFDRDDVGHFVRQWHQAYERAVHPDNPNPQQAEMDAVELIHEIQASPRVESLATNPLMLTIIALIKHHNITLPERRVELYEIALNTLVRSWNKARSLARRPLDAELGLEETKRVWAPVACWMHEAKSTGTCRRDELLEHVVCVLHNMGKDAFDAVRIAESYLTAAAESAGLLEERGPDVFAFLHQTFQEYLAARHLARPHSRVIERVLELSPDPRWHEVIRLTAGYIGVIQEDDEMATDLIRALVQDARCPLEPFLCSSLRLATSCIRDAVGVHPQLVTDVVVRTCERLWALPYDHIVESLVQSLVSTEHLPFGPKAISSLIELATHHNARIRWAAAHLLGTLTPRHHSAAQCLHRLWTTDDDPHVRAEVALCLWHTGRRDDPVILAMLNAGTPSSAFKSGGPDQGLTVQVLRLLRKAPHWKEAMRSTAVDVLGQLQPDEQARTAALALLKNEKHSVQSCAARVLARWGPEAIIASIMNNLLQDAHVDVQTAAAWLLGEWTVQAELVPVLLGLLEHTCPRVRYVAARTVGRWGHTAEASRVMIALLSAGDTTFRNAAADALVEWGPVNAMTAALLTLLDNSDDETQCNAALVLAKWGHTAQAMPVLIRLMEEGRGVASGRAIEALIRVGPLAESMQGLCKWLQHDDAIRRGIVTRILGKWGASHDTIPFVIILSEDDKVEVRSRATQVLSDWGSQSQTTPALLKRLEDEDVDIQLLAAKSVAWRGHRAEAVAVLVRLLESSVAAINNGAAEVLSELDGRYGAARAVLGKLIPDDVDAVTTYFEGLADRKPQLPDERVARLLVKAIKPVSSDSEHINLLRGVVCRWLWQASQVVDARDALSIPKRS